jgi:hypothetical protein
MIFMILNIALLLVPIIFSLYILRVERRDIKCEVLDDDSTCNGDGMSWSGARPKDNDTVVELLERIKRASNAETHSIKWRRSLILSIALVYIICVLNLFMENQDGLPEWQNVYILVALFFLVLYFTYDYYSYHVYSIPRKHIRDSVHLLKQRLGISADQSPIDCALTPSRSGGEPKPSVRPKICSLTKRGTYLV